MNSLNYMTWRDNAWYVNDDLFTPCVNDDCSMYRPGVVDMICQGCSHFERQSFYMPKAKTIGEVIEDGND